jgi:hypothetical protein
MRRRQPRPSACAAPRRDLPATRRESFGVPYGGPALASRTRYYWQVRVWDNYGRVSPWSQPAWFETAFLNPSQFQGSWIGQYPDSQQQNAAQGELLFRKQFSLTGPIARARLYAVGLSYPYININGRAVSNHMLDTAFTTFNKTVDYTTYDVTRLLQQNANAVAVSLGHGFYAGGADDYPSSGEPWQPTQPELKLGGPRQRQPALQRDAGQHVHLPRGRRPGHHGRRDRQHLRREQVQQPRSDHPHGRQQRVLRRRQP